MFKGDFKMNSMSSWLIIMKMCDVAIKEKEQQELLFHKGYSNYRGNVHPSLPIPDIIHYNTLLTR